MALPLPTTNYVIAYAGDGVEMPAADPDRTDYVQARIQGAADLLALATGVYSDIPATGDPAHDAVLYRVVTEGIADMAVYLLVNRSEMSESYSPYTSERIGSYSYSKALKTKALSGATDVMYYDQAVAALLNAGATSAMGNLSVGGEQVFTPGVPFSAWGGADPGYGGLAPPAWPPR